MITTLKKLRNGLRYPFVCSHDGLVAGKRIQFHVNNGVEQYRLQKFGGEEDMLKALLKLLLPADVVLDIGASVGAWSIPIAAKVSGGKVVSFEPDPENQQRLLANYQLNGLTNFQMLPVALGDQPGELELFTEGANGYSPSLRPVNFISTTIKVKVETVDGLLASGAIPTPTVVKIDIEGAEMMALRGMVGLLRSEKKPRVLQIEVHPEFLPSFDTDMTEVFKFLIENGYKITELINRNAQIISFWSTN